MQGMSPPPTRPLAISCAQVKQLTQPQGLNNLLYSPDVFFSCFADLALVSPVDYFREGQGSLMQVVITPAAPYMPWSNEDIAAEADRQVREVPYVVLLAQDVQQAWHTQLHAPRSRSWECTDCMQTWFFLSGRQPQLGISSSSGTGAAHEAGAAACSPLRTCWR